MRAGRGAVGTTVSIACLAVLVAACAGWSGTMPNGDRSTPGGDPSTAGGAPVEAAALTVYAASSLTRALDAVRPAYEAVAPGTSVTVSTDSSAALEAKIEQGAPADLFLSADTGNPEKLVDEGLAVGRVTIFARNLLTVIVPPGNPAGIRSPADLGRPGVKIIAAGDRVPISGYADRLVANLAATAGYPADFAARYGANVVSREDNVAAVVSKIELGEGDAAIVYATDAKASSKVATIDVPAAANVPATYGGVVVRSSAQTAAAAAFLAWLAGPGGQAILGPLGFLPPT